MSSVSATVAMALVKNLVIQEDFGHEVSTCLCFEFMGSWLNVEIEVARIFAAL